MNPELLIDSIVRQTTVLIAQLATATGGRYPLAHTANQVFSDMIRELKEQGLGNKVISQSTQTISLSSPSTSTGPKPPA